MKWLILIYRIPREPTAGRVFVWRKLKQLGAISLQDAVWVLPHNSRTQEQFQWLCAEISECGGEASVWESQQFDSATNLNLQRAFTDAADSEYREVLAGLRKRGADLAALSRQFQAAQERDHFGADLGRKVRDKLLAAGEGRRT